MKKKMTRPQKILKAIGRKKGVKLADILSISRADPKESKFYASILIRLVEKKILKRKKFDGFWHYSA